MPAPSPGATSSTNEGLFQRSYCSASMKTGQPSISSRRRSFGPTRSSPSAKHIGELPSQQPPDWKNISGPCSARRRRSAARAASVATILRAGSACIALEEPERLRVVGDEHALRLRVVVEHHLVVLAPDPGHLVATERGVCRIEVVAVRPHAACLDAAAHAERPARVAGPDARAETVERVVRDLERLLLALERGHREHGAEDLLLEDPHVV